MSDDGRSEAPQTLEDLEEFLAGYPGGTSLEEALALSGYAERCSNDAIVEIGSSRGRSAVALAFGQARGPLGETGRVWCVDPHLPFAGLYRGRFGHDNRRDFYSVMLRTGFYARVSLINLPSAAAARAWDAPIGLLFIDGDHRPEAVRKDVEGWEPFLTPGGVLIFDDALDTEAGPFIAIERLLESRRFERIEAIGKMVALRKLVPAIA